MSKKVWGGHWITAGVGAMALAGLMSCADVADDPAPDAPGHQTLAAAPKSEDESVGP